MSQNHKRPATARAARPGRRPRRSASLSLTTLEDRRLMTAGVATMAIAPVDVQGVPSFETRMIASEPASLTIAGDSGPSDAWIHMGSEAQFGPTASHVLYGGGNAWPMPSPVSSPDATPEQAKLDAAFAKQSADMQSIQDKSEVTPKLLASLRTARAAVADQAGEPDATLLQTFQDDVQKVQESGTFTDEQQSRLKDEYTAVLKSAGVSDDAISALFAAQDAVKAASHVTSDDVALLAADQEAVQTLLDAMPHDAVAFAAAGAAQGGAGGAPLTVQGGAAVNVTERGLPSAVRVSPADTMLAGAGVDPDVDPATLAATSGPVATTNVPLAVTSTLSPNHTLYARAISMARGTTPMAGLASRPLGNTQWSTTSTPVARSEASSGTPLDSVIRRMTTRSMNNVRRVPAIRQRIAFSGSMRRPGNS